MDVVDTESGMNHSHSQPNIWRPGKNQQLGAPGNFFKKILIILIDL
jgi:hypothetical protein